MDDVVSKRGKALPAGNDQWAVRDDGVRVEFVDLITEARHANGVVYLSFASGIIDGRGRPPSAQMTARLRMHLASANHLHELLGNVIRAAVKAADKSQAN